MSSGDITYDWTQSEEQILVDMIRADNFNRPLTTQMLSFGTPEAINPTAGSTYNTAVEISATSAAPFSGSQTHRYHRVDISNFVYNSVTSLLFFFDYIKTKEELVAELSRRLEINLTPDKVNFTFPSDVGTYTLSIASHSLCYYGSLELTFANDIKDIDEVIVNNNLVGFYY